MTASWHGFQHVTQDVRHTAVLQRPHSSFTCQVLFGEAALHTHQAAQQLPPRCAMGWLLLAHTTKAFAATLLHSLDFSRSNTAFQQVMAAPGLYTLR